jgi:hypothetical protein
MYLNYKDQLVLNLNRRRSKILKNFQSKECLKIEVRGFLLFVKTMKNYPDKKLNPIVNSFDFLEVENLEYHH